MALNKKLYRTTLAFRCLSFCLLTLHWLHHGSHHCRIFFIFFFLTFYKKMSLFFCTKIIYIFWCFQPSPELLVFLWLWKKIDGLMVWYVCKLLHCCYQRHMYNVKNVCQGSVTAQQLFRHELGSVTYHHFMKLWLVDNLAITVTN